MASEVCDNCRKQIAGRPRVTMTGRHLCRSCADRLTGLAAGAITSGGDPGQSIASAGVFARLRARRRRGDSAG